MSFCSLASLLFYAWGEPRFVLLLARPDRAQLRRGADHRRDRRARRRSLATALRGRGSTSRCSACSNMPISSIGTLNAVLPAGDAFALPGLALPLGISFFTFHAISYLIDVHRGEVAPTAIRCRSRSTSRCFRNSSPARSSATTLSRASSARRMTLGRASAGLRIFIIGLAQKVLIADEVARLAEAVFDKVGTPSSGGGLARAWRLHDPDLFRFRRLFQHGDRAWAGARLRVPAQFPPALYVALDHRVLAPLAHQPVAVAARLSLHPARRQPRHRRSRPTAISVLVFLLCGLWHGANWTFVIWGVHHGAFLIARARRAAPLPRAGAGAGARLYALVAVMTGWVWFRARDARSRPVVLRQP